MKLVIWGATETGKSALAVNIQNYFSIPYKINYKGGMPLDIKDSSFIIKALVDNRMYGTYEKNFFYFLDKLSSDTKHLFIYRKNLLSQFLAWHHIDSLHYNSRVHNNMLKVEELDLNMCKDFLKMIKEDTKKTYDLICKNTKHYIVMSYEDLFFNIDSRKIFNKFLNVDIPKIRWEEIIGPQTISSIEKTKDMRFVLDNNIEKYSYKQNFNILKDMFIDEQLIL